MFKNPNPFGLSNETLAFIAWQKARLAEIYALSDHALGEFLSSSARDLWCHYIIHYNSDPGYESIVPRYLVHAEEYLASRGDPDKDRKALWQSLLQEEAETYHNQQSSEYCRYMDIVRCSYQGGFVFDLIPEVVKRLTGDAGGQSRNDHSFFTGKTGFDFRCAAGATLANLGRNLHSHQLEDCLLLEHDFVNGNPLAFAVDRIYPPEIYPPETPINRSDTLACHTREISLARGLPEQSSWTPGMQHYDKNHAVNRIFTGEELDDSGINVSP